MRVAAIQATPVYLNPEKTTEKAIGLMADAAKEGAELCSFSEVFLAGYPLWLRSQVASMDDGLQRECYSRYLDAAVDADGPELAALAEQAKKLGLFTYIGFVERAPSQGAVFCSLAAIHPDKGIVGVHRKLKPTYFERMIWAEGDAHGLQVHPWKDFRVGGLLCFENWQPLPRHALYAQGEQLHVATWPGRITHHECARFVAMEGRVYVISVAGVMDEKDIPDDFPLKGRNLNPGLAFSGGSTIFGPNGDIVAGPLESEEAILYADIDVKRVNEERMRRDPAGHYGRPDVFRVEVDRTRHEHLYEADE